jgi:hypothetical protein
MQQLTQILGDSVRPVHDTGVALGLYRVARNQKRGGSIWANETAD